MLKLAVKNTAAQVAEFKRGETSAAFECKECGYRAYISINQAEAHEEKCKGRKPKVRRTTAQKHRKSSE